MDDIIAAVESCMSSYDSFEMLFLAGCKIRYRGTDSYFYYNTEYNCIGIHNEDHGDILSSTSLLKLYQLFCDTFDLYMDVTPMKSFHSVRYLI